MVFYLDSLFISGAYELEIVFFVVEKLEIRVGLSNPTNPWGRKAQGWKTLDWPISPFGFF